MIRPDPNNYDLADAPRARSISVRRTCKTHYRRRLTARLLSCSDTTSLFCSALRSPPSEPLADDLGDETRSRRVTFVLAVECQSDIAHEAIHLFLYLRVGFHANVEVEDHLREAGGFDLLEHVRDVRRRA